MAAMFHGFYTSFGETRYLHQKYRNCKNQQVPCNFMLKIILALQANQYPIEISVNVAFVLFWITITLQNRICKIGLVDRMALWWAEGFRSDMTLKQQVYKK